MKKIAFHIAIIGIVLLVVFLLDYFSFGCPIRAITHFPCPTCGVTRSLLALLRLDFAQSFSCHPMTIPLCLVILLAIHRKKIRMNSILYHILVIGTAVLTFAVYIIRLATHSIA